MVHLCHLFLLIIFMTVSKVSTYNRRTCVDCVNIAECPNAQFYFHSTRTDKVQRLTESFCGFQNGFKFCCVDFHPNNNLLPKQCGGRGLLQGEEQHGHNVFDQPWLALLIKRAKNEDRIVCLGSIISRRYVLTVAHCFVKNPPNLVTIGEHDIYTRNFHDYHLQEFGMELVLAPKTRAFHQHKETTDIALVKLSGRINFDFFAQPICLPIKSEHRSFNLVGESATVAGWGPGRTISPHILQTINVGVYENYWCGEKYRYESSVICAGYMGRDACSGDSGAPLTKTPPLSNGPRILYGIVVSGNRRCGSVPAVYASVEYHLRWILDNMRK